MESLEVLDHTLFSPETEKLRKFYASKLVGQSKAVDVIAGAYEEYLSPLWKRECPIITALFLGPSGVGKTYVAKILSEFLFGNQNGITVIECGSYKEEHRIAQLIGAPPGYLGHHDRSDPKYDNPPLLHQKRIDKPAVSFITQSLIEGGDIIIQNIYKDIERLQNELRLLELSNSSKVILKSKEEELNRKVEVLHSFIAEKKSQQKINSIILFDEIEKAHASLHDFLLQVVEEGQLTMGNGDKTHFYDSFIFLTSNIGSRAIADEVRGTGKIGYKRYRQLNADISRIARTELQKIFKPELLGRLEGNIAVFNELSTEDLNKILDIQLWEFQENLIKKCSIQLIIDRDTKAFILRRACGNPEFGARELRNKIKELIKAPVSKLINTGQIVKSDKVLVQLSSGNIVFLKEKA